MLQTVIITLFLCCAVLAQQATSFMVRPSDGWQPHLSARNNMSMDDSDLVSRRQLLSKVAICALANAAAASQVQLASAEDTIWLTGKMPKIPGQKPKEKNDVSGTRKDPNFLRSLSDCKNQCEKNIGSDGYAKTKEECLSECQDICCTTYQQCTFAIVQRI